MARSRGPIYIADNSVVAINDALQQLLFMIDELKGETDETVVTVGPHTHAGSTSGGLISHDTGLSDVSADDHHARDHQARHNEGGADELKLDDLGTPDDNTDLDATATEHGLLPKLDGNNTHWLDGTGAWTAVPGANESTDVANVEGDATMQIWEQIMCNDQSLTISTLANGQAIDLSVSSAGGSAGKQFVLMMMEL